MEKLSGQVACRRHDPGFQHTQDWMKDHQREMIDSLSNYGLLTQTRTNESKPNQMTFGSFWPMRTRFHTASPSIQTGFVRIARSGLLTGEIISLFQTRTGPETPPAAPAIDPLGRLGEAAPTPGTVLRGATRPAAAPPAMKRSRDYANEDVGYSSRRNQPRRKNDPLIIAPLP